MKTLCNAFLILMIFIGSDACSPRPFHSANKQYRQRTREFAKLIREEPADPVNDTIRQPDYFVGTTNFGIRKPDFVIIHHTAQNSCLQTLQTFTTPRTAVSAHYVICKGGVVHHMLNDYLRGQHAGVSRWGNLIDVNSSSIGIELDNTGFEPFDSLQINSLISLLGNLKKKYNIPTANFIGHGDIAPTRKNDPNYRFPWKKLAEKGFGLWYDAQLEPVPEKFDYLLALRIVGYDIKDTTAAIRSFKRHFLQDTSRSINETDKMVLYDLEKKYK